MVSSKTFQWSVTQNIGILAMNNGPQNLINGNQFIELDTLKNWIDGEKIKGLIVTGGKRHFSSGADMNYLKQASANMQQFEKELKKCRKILDYISSLDILTIAQISGVCFGAGLEIALSCHMRICSSRAILAMPESNHNIMPGLTGTIRLPRLVGYNKALEMILSGNTVNAKEALKIGLVDYIAPKNELSDFTLGYITKITQNKPLHVVKSIIQSLNNGYSLNRQDAFIHEAKMFCRLANKEFHLGYAS
ncbi:MAG: enoyl-CoA hydratase/isomerase family protein [Proteobacteria bacterium]|nr:enoyl-CoA hydratase/isomerase family protein [Pseudomonadota bacterium]MBU1585641.1 enoyl-CoA hydratase/isomerase family protein [Pseudomonadota bacterium]MBU2629639.1 enoyl-CoA hydratase/isomerase family protein [Pseudomonadota bacterium]